MKSLAVVLAAAAISVGANAALLTKSGGTLDASSNTGELSDDGSFSLFNPGVNETLKRVEITFTGDVSTAFVVTNSTNLGVDGNVADVEDRYFGSSLGALDAILNPLGNATIQFTLRAGMPELQSANFPAGESRTQAFTDDDSFTLVFAQGANGFNDFIGSGNFLISCSSVSFIDQTPSSLDIATVDLNRNCGASLVYTYDDGRLDNPAPEPGSLALVGLALAGVSAARRKIRKA